MRRRSTPIAANAPSAEREAATTASNRLHDSRRTAWADLLQRVFEVDALRCPHCGARMWILSAITDTDVARSILDCLRIPSRAPPLAVPRPQAKERFEEFSSEFDWGDDSGFDFDQSGLEPE